MVLPLNETPIEDGGVLVQGDPTDPGAERFAGPEAEGPVVGRGHRDVRAWSISAFPIVFTDSR